MRSTRNTAKGTPPPAKKTGKGTPGKGTPKTPAAEKKDEILKGDADPGDVELVISIESSSQTLIKSDGAEASKEETNVEAIVAEVTEIVKEPQASDSKASATKKTAGTPKKKTDETSEKEAVLVVSKTEVVEEVVVLGETEKVTEGIALVEESEKTEASKAEEVEGTDNKEGDDEEMEEGGEDDIEDAEDEEDDNDDEEDEDGEDEEGEGEADLVDEGPMSERRKPKKLEVFVGGLAKEATAEEVKKTFEVVGEVVEVRLTMHPQSGKNKGYAFVRFATIEQAAKAALELDKIKIRDKECAVVPSEDNDTLFVGNLCKSWSPAQILEKLKEYGVEGISDLSLPDDQEHEGQSKGHGFLEFETHTDALKAFKRLSKPDAIFGCDRSARVAWAEGSSEPDEITMSKVKSVFIDGMPPEWDDEKLKEHFGKYGDIERIVLAKNIPKSKRQDFGFVNYATRDAAVAAIEALKDAELADGDKKVTLKVELAKPAPRKKRVRGHRGSYPVGGGPSKQKKGKGVNRQKGDEGRSMVRGGRGGRGNFRGAKRKSAEERPSRDERSQIQHHPGPKFARGAAASRGRRGARGGFSSGRGDSGAQSDEDYLPMGARMNPGSATTRKYSGRPPRRGAYPRRGERDYAHSGSKRSYSVLDEEAVYYESAQRGYPRPRVEYVDPAFDRVSHYSRSAPLGHSSLGQVLPVRGSLGYASALPADYNGYGLAGPADPRGASYPSAYYGSRAGPYY